MQADRSKFMSLPIVPTLTAVLHHVWPAVTGLAVGDVVANIEQWKSPTLAAVIAASILQLLIAVFRAYFTERREVIQAWKEMQSEQRASYLAFLESEKQERHAMANRVAKAEMRLLLLKSGVPPARMPEIPDIYEGDPSVERVQNQSAN
jgi:hypothetical protein